MTFADIKLGYTCNNNCIHCVIADQKKDALRNRGNIDRTTEEYKKELIDSRLKGITSVTFTGGEPTIRKDLLELVEFAKQIGMKINMQTNGRMFCYNNFAKKFTPFNIYYTVALHHHIGNIHDQITRAEKSFQQTITGIKNLVSTGQFVVGKTVISKINYRSLPEIAMKFIELKVKKINFAFPHAQGNAWKYFDDVVPRYTDIKAFVNKAISICEENNMPIEFEAIPFCFMQGNEKYISELKLKNKGDYIELKQLDGKKTNWQTKRIEIKKKFSQCNDCKYNEICEGPWKEYPIKFGSDEFRPIRGLDYDSQDT